MQTYLLNTQETGHVRFHAFCKEEAVQAVALITGRALAQVKKDLAQDVITLSRLEV